MIFEHGLLFLKFIMPQKLLTIQYKFFVSVFILILAVEHIGSNNIYISVLSFLCYLIYMRVMGLYHDS